MFDRKQAARNEIRYTLLVFAFIAGRTPPETPPIAAEYGVSPERASEIIGIALLCDVADKALAQQHGLMNDSTIRPILRVRIPHHNANV